MYEATFLVRESVSERASERARVKERERMVHVQPLGNSMPQHDVMHAWGCATQRCRALINYLRIPMHLHARIP